MYLCERLHVLSKQGAMFGANLFREIFRIVEFAAILGGTLGILQAASGEGEADVRYLPTEGERATVSAIVESFMTKYRVPGLSVAISRQGRFVYREAFGFADRDRGEKTTPEHLFRIASISKPITAVGILSLVEKGRLRLDSRIFGQDGLLGFDYGAKFPPRVMKLTINDLLGHTGGGWGNDGRDPMFRESVATRDELIARTVKNDALEFEPGTRFCYSNFGYCLLGRVVEKLTGQPYADWISQNILSPCGISDMRIASNVPAAKGSGEVTYYSSTSSPYQFDIPRMDSHGGWLGTPTDLVRFANRVDGFGNLPGLLTEKTIQVMSTPGRVSPHYAKGWFVNAEPNWWHGGVLPGTASILVRTSDNFSWAAFANTHTPGIDIALDRMMWEIKNAVPAWRNR